MKFITPLILLLLLSACGSSSKAPSPVADEQAKVLNEHACLEGTWLAVSRNIKINGVNYPVATQRIFMVVTGQKNVTTEDDINDLKTSYLGTGLRTWRSEDGITEDIYANAWSTSFTFDNTSDLSTGMLSISNACRKRYAGAVLEDVLPQCEADQTFTRLTQVSLDCSGEVDYLTMENAKTSINYQRITDNNDVTEFNRTDSPEAVTPDAQPPEDVDLFDEDQILEILEQELPNETDEAIEEVLDDLINDDDIPLSPDEDPEPVDPGEPDPAPPTEQDPRNVDTDGDGIPDHLDAFPNDAGETADYDNDGTGNNSDPDDDNDDVLDENDAFPLNEDEWLDTDHDNVGNNSDADDDNDGISDTLDVFPLDDSEWIDTDGDGLGNNFDADDDGDFVPDLSDAFPLNVNEWLDTDGDGIGDNSDTDDDNDNWSDLHELSCGTDAFNPNSTPLDFDEDGQCNTLDNDDDGDGVLDIHDAFPLNSTEWLDADGDGTGDNSDTDDDNDGVLDINDAFPNDPNESVDSDGDGVGDNADAFPNDANESIDSDGDGVGDNADAFPNDANESVDTDGDGVGNNSDAFPNDASESTDTDGDGIGDANDLDDDNDTWADTDEAACGTNSLNPNSVPSDNDGDHSCDLLDTDDDNDGILDANDAFPLDATESVDTDGDGIGNNADSDDDNDGISDILDAFPLDESEWIDTDGDGFGNNFDADDDGDLVLDINDAFPLNANEWLDTDGDSIGNNADTDDDGDGVLDINDAFSLNANEWLDTDGDGIGNNADLDDDGDGIPDNEDEDPLNPPAPIPDTDGDGINDDVDTDDDNDGVLDSNDAFPLDANEWLDTDSDSIGNNADLDDDADSVLDVNDAFPLDANEWLDTDGDGIGNNADLDNDGDGVLDINDAFPLDATESLDTDGDGIGNNADLDDDGDGVLDINDVFPLNADESIDTDGDGIGNNADLDDDGDGILDVDDDDPLNPAPPAPTDPAFAMQDWQSFVDELAPDQNWFLTDFDLFLDSPRTDYMVDGNILFDISWTKRTRNHMADLLGFDREYMTRDVANAFCAPQVEVGKASIYGVGNSENLIAELDGDLSACLVDATTEPAAIRIRSFIPTKVGYHYKAQVKYRMRSYANMPSNAYRHLVMRFGKTVQHFEPVFGEFMTATIDILASHKFSKLVLKDNGLPDSYGILIDDIEVFELEKSELFDQCEALFAQNSKGFRKCILGEIETEQSCTMDNFTFNYQPHGEVSADRQITENALVNEGPISGTINFLSLGKKGSLTASCYIDDYLAAYPIHNQQLSLREISWGNANIENYPEQARISVRLSHCLDDRLNGTNHLGLVGTSESFSYDFVQSEDGFSYEGCRLKKLIIRDKTPKKSPSPDGFDLNSLEFSDL